MKMLKIILPQSNKMKQKKWDKKGRKPVGLVVGVRNEQRLLELMIGGMKIRCQWFLMVVNWLGGMLNIFFYLDDEDKQGWHRGVVLAMSVKGRSQVCYNCFQDVIYWRQIYKNFKVGYVRLVELKPKDFIGVSIWHMYADGESNENTWWNREVVDVDPDTSDANEPDFFVIYDESGEAKEGQQAKQEYYLTPLLGYYLNHWVQVISLDLVGEHGPEQ